MNYSINVDKKNESKIEWPLDRADKAYVNGSKIEAIQILHNYIEFKMQEVLMLIGSVHFDAELSKTWAMPDDLNSRK